MATKKVQPVDIVLDIKGKEKLSSLNSSFRDLSKQTKLADKDIVQATKDIVNFSKDLNVSEATIKGQIKALEGLREQAAIGGKVYGDLSRGITELKARLNGSTSAIDAQRKSLLETAGSAKVTQSQLLSVANALSTLQKQTALGSKAFVELGADIASLEGKIAKVKTEQEELNKLNFAANQMAAGGAAATRQQIRAIDARVASLREEKRVREELEAQRRVRYGMQEILDRPGDVPFRSREYIEQAVATSLLAEEGLPGKKLPPDLNILKMFAPGEILAAVEAVKKSVAELQVEIERDLGRSARRAFQEMAREGRESARSLAIAFSGLEFERIFANLEKNVGELPNTTAGLSQRLRELERVLNNTARGGDNYVAVALEIARVQREASAATQGLGAALINDLASGVAVRNQKNLREAIGQLQAEMSELNTETAEGSAKYAENARQVNRLQKELDGIANSYRNVADMARRATSSQVDYRAIMSRGYAERDKPGYKTPAEIRGRQFIERIEAEGQALRQVLALPAAGQTTAPGTGALMSGLAKPKIAQEARLGTSAGERPDQPSRAFPGDVEAIAARRAIGPVQPGPSGQAYIYAAEARRKEAEAAQAAADAVDNYKAEIHKAREANDGSINSSNRLRSAIIRFRDTLPTTGKEFAELTKEINDLDRQSERVSRRMSRRRMSAMQMTQAAGAVLSGGIFGGPEGFIGGAVGALGGVGGAFAGAAIGAQVGGIRRTLGEYTEYAAQIARLKIALEGIAGSQDQYNRALAAAADVTKSLNVPQDVAIQGITRLTAAVKGAGGGVADAELAFKNINSAIIATGGGAEQVQGAVTALVQIFSKGKVSAEEINQIAERLPGTFNKIAAASGRTGPELTKALQDGKVGLNDLMKFLVSLGDEYGELAKKIAGSSENAGARLQRAFDQMRENVGKALQPIGAEFQDAFTEFIKDITPTLVAVLPKIGELALGLMKNLTQLAQAASGLASFAVRLAAINLALKGFAALKGPVSTMFILLKSGFRASSQQAALAQGKLIAFGTTVRTLAASLAAPVVITFAVVGAEMVISYFNRIKKAREDLEATAKKPQGEVFFQSIGGTAATKQTLQRNINDITKNLDILRDRVKSTKEEIASYQKTVDTFDPSERASGLGVPAPDAKDVVPEDLRTRLQADEAEIKRLVLNYRTLIDKYLDAPDEPGRKVFDEPKPNGTGTGTGTGGADKGPKSRLAELNAQYDSMVRGEKGVLEIMSMRQEQAMLLARATADNNQELISTVNLNNIILDFAERELEVEKKLLDDLDKASKLGTEAEQIRATEIAQRERNHELAKLLLGTEGAIALEKQRAAIAEEERSKAMSDQLFTLREQLGLVTDNERIARFRQEQEKQFGQDDPRVAEATDLFRQTVAPTFAEGLSQKMRELKKDLKELVNPINQVAFAADTIGTAFGKAFSDVVTGSASAKEALAGMMQSIGQSFIQMAAQIIAKQTTMIILGTIMKALGIAGAASGGFESAPLGEGFSSGATPSSFDAVGAGIFTPKANGGPVRGGQAYMVGERGPELFVPSTNGGVMRNEDMRRLMGRSPAGAGSQPAMNFTFETTNIGGTEYVSREQLEAAMATTRRQAANDGAKRGMNMTLDRMQNSPRTRARVGIS